jgi:hypothetical protein
MLGLPTLRHALRTSPRTHAPTIPCARSKSLTSLKMRGLKDLVKKLCLLNPIPLTQLHRMQLRSRPIPLILLTQPHRTQVRCRPIPHRPIQQPHRMQVWCLKIQLNPQTQPHRIRVWCLKIPPIPQQADLTQLVTIKPRWLIRQLLPPIQLVVERQRTALVDLPNLTFANNSQLVPTLMKRWPNLIQQVNCASSTPFYQSRPKIMSLISYNSLQTTRQSISLTKSKSPASSLISLMQLKRTRNHWRHSMFYMIFPLSHSCGSSPTGHSMTSTCKQSQSELSLPKLCWESSILRQARRFNWRISMAKPASSSRFILKPTYQARLCARAHLTASGSLKCAWLRSMLKSSSLTACAAWLKVWPQWLSEMTWA